VSDDRGSKLRIHSHRISRDHVLDMIDFMCRSAMILQHMIFFEVRDAQALRSAVMSDFHERQVGLPFSR